MASARSTAPQIARQVYQSWEQAQQVESTVITPALHLVQVPAKASEKSVKGQQGQHPKADYQKNIPPLEKQHNGSHRIGQEVQDAQRGGMDEICQMDQAMTLVISFLS